MDVPSPLGIQGPLTEHSPIGKEPSGYPLFGGRRVPSSIITSFWQPVLTFFRFLALSDLVTNLPASAGIGKGIETEVR